MCIIFHNMWQALVPRRRRLKQVLSSWVEIKTEAQGDPWRLRNIFPLLSSRDKAFLHVARQASAPNIDFCDSLSDSLLSLYLKQNAW